MSDDNAASEQDAMADEWAAALAEAKPAAATELQTEQVAPAPFTNFSATAETGAGAWLCASAASR